MGMENYMGYRAEAVQSPERLLPKINIAGTLFVVDIKKLEFREAGNPHNRMPIIGAKEEMGFSHFFFDTKAKNHYAGDTKMPDGIPDHVRIVLLPPLKDLDPAGFALQQGLKEDAYSRQTAVKPVLASFSKEKQEQDLPVKRKSRHL